MCLQLHKWNRYAKKARRICNNEKIISSQQLSLILTCCFRYYDLIYLVVVNLVKLLLVTRLSKTGTPDELTVLLTFLQSYIFLNPWAMHQRLLFFFFCLLQYEGEQKKFLEKNLTNNVVRHVLNLYVQVWMCKKEKNNDCKRENRIPWTFIVLSCSESSYRVYWNETSVSFNLISSL